MDRFDVLAVLGMLVMASGIGLIDYRFGLIVLGLGLIGWAVIGARVQNVASGGKVHQGEIPRGQKTAARNDKAA